ncbi:MAG: DUF1501 domain-containing protein [Gemmataceae bacterium]
MLKHAPLDRRAFLQVGASSFVGLNLPGLLSARASNSESHPRQKSVILVLLTGGASHLDMLDMKPDAPAEIRGEFSPIATTLPGFHVCEHLPRLAMRMDRWAVVRSLSHGENGHLPATHRILTGSPMPNQRGSDLDNVLSRRDWPCYAAGLNAALPRHDGIPSGVTLPHSLIEGPLTWPGQHGGFLGPAHDPLLVTQDPNSPNFRMDSLALLPDLQDARLRERVRLMDHVGTSNSTSFRHHQAKAVEMLTSGQAAAAFRLDREPNPVRDRYGRHSFGQTLLLARRLVQAGVPMIQANMGIVQTWDTHSENWERLKHRLLPQLDQALAALIDDLTASGLLGETLVAVLGEFGRTPRISNLPGSDKPGRDHWAAVYSGMFAGAGVRGGRVIGRSDRTGAFPVDSPFTPYDVGATIYQILGLDPDAEVRDTLNRPWRLNAGQPIRPLFA